jgi:hypothetical protein
MAADPVKESILRIASLVYQFHLPKGKKNIFYGKSFILTDMPQATVSALEQADTLRNRFMDEVLAPNENPPAISAAAEKYIPALHRIITSIDASVSPNIYPMRTRGPRGSSSFTLSLVMCCRWTLCG